MRGHTWRLRPPRHLRSNSVRGRGISQRRRLSSLTLLPLGATYWWVVVVDTDANGVPNGTLLDFVEMKR